MNLGRVIRVTMATLAAAGSTLSIVASAPEAAPLVAPARPQIIRIKLRADTKDHFLPRPSSNDVTLALDARAAPPKARVMFLQPLAAGAHRLRLEVSEANPDRTFVIAVPVSAGRSTFDVTIVGAGRYDFGFFAGDPGSATQEYRFTRTAPLAQELFTVVFTGRRQ